MTLTERCADIKGLAEGLNLNADKAEAKLINALIELCSEMAEEIECLGEDVEDLIDYCEELDEDLGDVEEVLIDEYDDEEFDGSTSHLVYSSEKTGKYPIRVKPRKTANYGFKLHVEGTGYMKLYELEIFVEAGGDLYV